MNIYAPTGVEVQSLPLWGRRMTGEYMLHKSRVIDREKPNEELSKEVTVQKLRCCDIWEKLTE